MARSGVFSPFFFSSIFCARNRKRDTDGADCFLVGGIIHYFLGGNRLLVGKGGVDVLAGGKSDGKGAVFCVKSISVKFYTTGGGEGWGRGK